ncbi:2-oxoglutarate dehydrogenase complex dihydrolipoyllysine-residue succinyltransferase [Alkanindiges sp. WGS2144]|uniref:2-oxoglutarate dehydrogenase complex dihydrolipoyllysine-residue succinyltransferase n=1 Tax=Alkanindiges sp. WGS2144 TaxID=3366808 RepID=UPI003750E63E
MATEIKAPVFPESVADGTVATWHKKVGEAVSRDEVIADIETDKVVLEVVAPADGSLTNIAKQEGDTVLSGEVIATFEAGAGAVSQEQVAQESQQSEAGAAPIVQRDEPAAVNNQSDKDQSPAVRKAVAETGVDVNNISGTGRGGRITKEDVANHANAPKAAQPASQSAQQSGTAISQAVGERIEKRVPMTRLRKRVAERLLSASQDTAMLTTFNEVNMKPIMDMRKLYQERFEKRHGTKLGFMSFFVKAATEALKRYPAVNASIDGDDIVYHGYYDIGVAVSSDRGLVVPVLRDTDRLNHAEVEKNIIDFGKKARDGKLSLDDMTGGTFTISNGGVFGSLLSTPILNPPQTAILGMHKIQERPMAVDGQVVILPMMYLALSYDHRMIDGKEAVGFLVAIKQFIEDPASLLLDL